MKATLARNSSKWTLGVFVSLVVLLAAPMVFAQSLNWEGQTGAFVTPFAYTATSPGNGFGHPSVSFHYLNGGDVIGGLYQVSATVGAFKRVELGYTRSLQSAGSTAELSPLFAGGFNVVHAKVNVISENLGKKKWVPAISFGGVARTQVRHVGGVINAKDTKNGDVYVVATKTITQMRGLPVVANFGLKATNAAVFGIAGNAPYWQGRAFGALGFVLPGPAKSKVVVGSEFAQQPHAIEGLPGATLPTALTYFARVLPVPEKPFNIDFGVAQAAGQVLPGANVKARAQFATGISYRF